MTAKGKITAARIAAGDRILVKHYTAENVADLSVLKYLGADHALGVSTTKTGEGVTVARVLKVEAKLVTGGRRDRRVYDIHTTEGVLGDNAPAQTMILAPEDAAGVKRAHVEALAANEAYDRTAALAEEALAKRAAAPAPVEFTAEERQELAEDYRTSGALDEVHADALVEYAARAVIDQNAAWLTRHDCDRATFENVQALIVKDHEEALALNPAQVVIGSASAETPGTVAYSQDREDLTLHSQDGKVDNMNNDANATQTADRENLRRGTEQMYGWEKAILRRAATIASDQGHQGEPLPTHIRIAEDVLITAAHDEANLMNTETAPDQPTAERHTGSSVVKLIEKVWDRIRADHPELPEVVVTTGSGEGVKWGHFRADSWKLEGTDGRFHEFFLASEALAKGAHQVLQTTIHEAAHTISKVRGIKDTSRQGRWHNAAFKKAAEELGLEHKGSKADASHGFSFVTLTQTTKDKYADLLAELDQELKLTGLLPFWLGGKDEQGGEDERGGEKITGKPTKGGGEGTKSGPLKATCQCEEPVIIRLSQKVLDLAVVRCDGCESLFRAA